MKMVIKVVEATPHERVGLQVNASGISLTMDIESLLDISPVDNGTKSKLNWKTQVTKRTGLISLVGASLIQGAAESVIKEGWEKLRARVET
jgi:carbon monoxide dehydrogenase subunit G